MAALDFNKLAANAAIQFMGGVNSLSVLVVGCNSGEDCKYFVEAGAAEVVGLDVSDNVGSNYSNPHTSYCKASAEDIPIESNKFDLVYCFATMEHVPNIRLAFSEMARVTRPGGCIYCLAAPLWHSAQGHHMSQFAAYPWIHLRKSKAELFDYCRENISNTDHDIRTIVNYMFDPNAFNMTPARAYIDACSRLPDMLIIENGLRFDSPALLSEEIFSELGSRGFEREELLARSHWYVSVKKSGSLISDWLKYLVLKVRYLVSTMRRVCLQLYLSRFG